MVETLYMTLYNSTNGGSHCKTPAPQTSFSVFFFFFFSCSRVMVLNWPRPVLHPGLLGFVISLSYRWRTTAKPQNSSSPLFLKEIDYWLWATTELIEAGERVTDRGRESMRETESSIKNDRSVSHSRCIGRTAIETERVYNFPSFPWELTACLLACTHPFFFSFLFSSLL